MKYISLSLPDIGGGTRTITPPAGVPTGGIGNTGTDIIQLVISLLFLFGLILTLIFIIFSGIQMIISGGEKQKVQNARNRLMYSVIGIVIIIFAFLIKNIIVTLLGADTKFFLNTP